MGFVISKTELTPFSVITGVIGLVSFGFTVGTFLRVVWVNFETFSEPTHEVHSFLNTLRSELLEERFNIKCMRRQSKRARTRRNELRDHNASTLHLLLDDVALKTMDDLLRHLIKQFGHVERPFLQPGADGIGDEKKHRAATRRRRVADSVSPYYEHAAYAPASEKDYSRRDKSRGRNDSSNNPNMHHRTRSRADLDRPRAAGEREEEEEEDLYWAQRTKYRPYTFRLRFAWLWRKSEMQQLFSKLTRVQIRRTARQVAGHSMYMHEAACESIRIEHVVERIEQRMNNIIGVRRVDSRED